MSDLKQQALDFHEFPVPGKISVTPTKSLATQHDLALAYSPGVAEPCLEIEKDPAAARRYTARCIESIKQRNIGNWREKTGTSGT